MNSGLRPTTSTPLPPARLSSSGLNNPLLAQAQGQGQQEQQQRAASEGQGKAVPGGGGTEGQAQPQGPITAVPSAGGPAGPSRLSTGQGAVVAESSGVRLSTALQSGGGSPGRSSTKPARPSSLGSVPMPASMQAQGSVGQGGSPSGGAPGSSNTAAGGGGKVRTLGGPASAGPSSSSSSAAAAAAAVASIMSGPGPSAGVPALQQFASMPGRNSPSLGPSPLGRSPAPSKDGHVV